MKQMRGTKGHSSNVPWIFYTQYAQIQQALRVWNQVHLQWFKMAGTWQLVSAHEKLTQKSRFKIFIVRLTSRRSKRTIESENHSQDYDYRDMAGIRGRQARSYFHLINTAEDKIGEQHEKLKGKKLHHCRLFLARAYLLGYP